MLQVETNLIPARETTNILLDREDVEAAILHHLIHLGGNLGDMLDRHLNDIDFKFEVCGLSFPLEVLVERTFTPAVPPTLPGFSAPVGLPPKFYLVAGEHGQRGWIFADSDIQAIERFRNSFGEALRPRLESCSILQREVDRTPGMHVANLDRSPS